MALNVPNIDRISKENPKLGEALSRVRDYTTVNVTPVAGNAVTPPPQPAQPPAPTSISRTPAPPTGHIKGLIGL